MNYRVVLSVSVWITFFYYTWASQLEKELQNLLEDGNALANLYQSHKNALKTNQTSALEVLLQEIFAIAEGSESSNPRHILTVLTDDQGYADVGYHDNSFITPTIDAIANRGIKFSSFYVHVCLAFFLLYIDFTVDIEFV